MYTHLLLDALKQFSPDKLLSDVLNLIVFRFWLSCILKDGILISFERNISMFTFLSDSGSNLRLSSGSACPPGLSTLNKEMVQDN